MTTVFRFREEEEQNVLVANHRRRRHQQQQQQRSGRLFSNWKSGAKTANEGGQHQRLFAVESMLFVCYTKVCLFLNVSKSCSWPDYVCTLDFSYPVELRTVFVAKHLANNVVNHLALNLINNQQTCTNI